MRIRKVLLVILALVAVAEAIEAKITYRGSSYRAPSTYTYSYSTYRPATTSTYTYVRPVYSGVYIAPSYSYGYNYYGYTNYGYHGGSTVVVGGAGGGICCLLIILIILCVVCTNVKNNGDEYETV